MKQFTKLSHYMKCIKNNIFFISLCTVQSQQQYTFKDLLNMELRWNSDVENVATAHSSEFFCESRSAGNFKTTLFPFDILASLNSGEPSPCTMSSSRKNNIQRWKLDWEIHSSKHFSKPTSLRAESSISNPTEIQIIIIFLIIFEVKYLIKNQSVLRQSKEE